MMAFFGGVGKVPIAVILMVSEMTGGLTLLVPSMIATAIAYVITGKNSIYRSQVQSKADSPAHRSEYSVLLMQKLLVKDAMTKKVITKPMDAPVSEIAESISKHGIKGMPIIDNNGKPAGIVTLADILKVQSDKRSHTKVSTIMAKDIVVAYPDDNIYSAYSKMINNQIGRLLDWTPASYGPERQQKTNRHNHAGRCMASLQHRGYVKAG